MKTTDVLNIQSWHHHADRVSNYVKYFPTLQTNGIEMPMALKDIYKFKKTK